MSPGGREGSVEAELLTSARRFAGPMRGIVLLLVSAFGLLAVPDDATGLGWALFTLVAVGAVVDVATALTGRAAPLALVLAVARVVAVVGCQDQLGGGEPNQWALNVLTATAITVQWEWPARLAVPVAAGLLAVEVAVVDGGAGTIVVRLLVEGALARLAFTVLRRSSRRVDRLRARRTALARAEAVALARHRREREYLALLHDTASSTFLLVAVHGRDTDPEQVAGYARRDLAVLTGTAGGHTTQDSPVSLAGAVRAVAAGGPLTVDVVAHNESTVPASVALAMVRAVREALANVERHAGVDAATVRVETGDGRAVVLVGDAGAGFSPDAVPASRRGLRGSVVERLAAVGGQATVVSSPGAGTTVRLVWPRG